MVEEIDTMALLDHLMGRAPRDKPATDMDEEVLLQRLCKPAAPSASHSNEELEALLAQLMAPERSLEEPEA